MSGRDDSSVRLGPGREFDLIRGFVGPAFGPRPGVVLGPGDDAAVLEGGWVVSQDLSVEEVHFRRDWLTDEEIGYRAVAAAVSDIAAMAGEPVAVLLAVAAPSGGTIDLAALQAGARGAGSSVGAVVVGGDLSRSPGPLFIDVTVLGRATRPILRRGARVGDELWVTGTLGDGGGALRALIEGREPDPELRDRYARPVPRVAAAGVLAGLGIPTSMLDLSDGLAGDAGHLAAASGVRIVIQRAALPVRDALRTALGEEEALDAALHAGEDFELCFTARPGAVAADLLTAEYGLALTRVGRVEPGDGVWIERTPDDVSPVMRGGYDHWRTL